MYFSSEATMFTYNLLKLFPDSQVLRYDPLGRSNLHFTSAPLISPSFVGEACLVSPKQTNRPMKQNPSQDRVFPVYSTIPSSNCITLCNWSPSQDQAVLERAVHNGLNAPFIPWWGLLKRERKMKKEHCSWHISSLGGGGGERLLFLDPCESAHCNGK